MLQIELENGIEQALSAYSDYPVVDVPRIDPMSAEMLRTEYLSGIGRPVIVRNAMADWPATRKWSFQFFADNYGSRAHITNHDLNATTGWKRLRFDDYLVYCQSPALSPLRAFQSERPFYSAFPLIQLFPELLADVPVASCVDNIYRQLDGKLAEWFKYIFEWVFIGPAVTITDLHVDHFMTHTYSAQIAGEKKFLFFSPECIHHLPGAGARKAERDLIKKAGFGYDKPVVVHEAIVRPGEMVIFPAGWAHYVVALEPSISVSVNFVDSSNYLEHVMSISRNLPSWAKRINGPLFREGNECVWSGQDFATLGGAAKA